MSTHYEVLQVSETASLDIIKQRFQQLILQVNGLFFLYGISVKITKLLSSIILINAQTTTTTLRHTTSSRHGRC